MMEMVARIRSLLRIKELHDQLHASRAALRDSLFRERKLLSKLRRDNAHLQVLATTDSLTRLQNAGSFREILGHEFHVARRYDHSLSLLMLDVDHFKLVNDTHGHPSGDYVLKELAVILKRSVRESDVVARTGGEEFGIILPKADRRRAAIFAARIRREVAAKEFAVYGHIIHVTASVGVATFPADAETTEPGMLLYFADQALLEAKETGRDRVVPFSGMDPSVRYRLRRQYAAMHSEKPQPVLDDALETRR
jgi:diguanylate cyclase (GGDEF)-like protein